MSFYEGNTHVSDPGYPEDTNASGSTNGATAPGANMAVSNGVLLIIGTAFVALFLLGKVTRKSKI
jgi:hypothetical protein